MNLLLLGSGGREHALAWKIAASPLLEKALLRARECRHRPGMRAGGARHRRPRGGGRLLPVAPDRSGRGRAGGAALRRDRGRSRRRRHQGVRPEQGRRPPRRLQGLHQGPVPGQQDTDRRLRAVHRRRAREGLRARAGRADRRQGRRARRRQGRRGRGERRGSRGRDRHDVRRRLGRGRRRGGGGGVSRRRGSLVLRALRRRDRDPARLGAGPQARARRRSGAQYRRHGRLLAGAGDDAGAHAPRHGRDRAADRARHEGDGRALQGRALCRADDHRRGAEADRIQRALRRSGNARC